MVKNLPTNLLTNNLFNIINILQPIGITSNGQIAQLVEQRTENLMNSSNINNLTTIYVRTNA